MKKTLLLALALTSVTLAGCAEEAAEDTDVTIENETIMADTTAGMEGDMMMDDTTGMGAGMEGDAMMGDTTTGAGAMTADTAATGM